MYPPQICNTCLRRKIVQAHRTPAMLCRAVSQTRSLCAINSFLLSALTVCSVRQTPETIHSSQGTEGVRVHEGIL